MKRNEIIICICCIIFIITLLVASLIYVNTKLDKCYLNAKNHLDFYPYAIVNITATRILYDDIPISGEYYEMSFTIAGANMTKLTIEGFRYSCEWDDFSYYGDHEFTKYWKHVKVEG